MGNASVTKVSICRLGRFGPVDPVDSLLDDSLHPIQRACSRGRRRQRTRDRSGPRRCATSGRRHRYPVRADRRCVAPRRVGHARVEAHRARHPRRSGRSLQHPLGSGRARAPRRSDRPGGRGLSVGQGRCRARTAFAHTGSPSCFNSSAHRHGQTADERRMSRPLPDRRSPRSRPRSRTATPG